MSHPHSHPSSGFTLIELLLVIGIIAVLAAIVIVAIQPSKPISEARDVQRKADVNAILSAVHQYVLDHDGEIPADIPVSPAPAKIICHATVDPQVCAKAFFGVNLRMLSGSYVKLFPKDPYISETGTGTYYTIVRDRSGRITVNAPQAERGEIKVTK